MRTVRKEFVKRIMDVSLSICGLICAAPLLAVASLAIVITDGSPVIFKQKRVGKDGSSFMIWKLRTMRHGTPGRSVSADNDSRITATGRLLRSSKIDELPQLVNVLRGEMSIVGPRPEVPEYVERWPTDLRPSILSVRPGITDPASIIYRNESTILAAQPDPESFYIQNVLPRKALIYADYVATRSIGKDVRILLQTIVRVIKR